MVVLTDRGIAKAYNLGEYGFLLSHSFRDTFQKKESIRMRYDKIETHCKDSAVEHKTLMLRHAETQRVI